MGPKRRIKSFPNHSAGPSQSGEARIGPIASIPSLLKELGVSPQQVFRHADLPLSVFDNPENRMSYDSIRHLMMVCCELTGRADFGLLLGSKFRLETLGELGDLMKVSATVRDALRMLILNFRHYDRLAFLFLLQPRPDRVFLGYSIELPARRSSPVFYDAVITMAFKLLRQICGPAWKPASVHFSYSQPEKLTPYRRMFGPDVRFDQEISGVLFDASWLDQAMPDADAEKCRQLNEEIQAKLASLPLTFSEEVQAVLHQMLLTGKTATVDIANLFGISDRTLRRKLNNEGTSMQSLLADTRYELARHLLLNTNLPVSKISADLGFADSAVFSRAFRTWAGTSPSRWRKDNSLRNGYVESDQ